MTRILAVETATDACSLALYDDGATRQLYQLAPRQHSQLVFAMLQELLPDRHAALALNCVAYGSGPGSFTGLRIAASLAQGLAFSLQCPALGISSLEAMAWAHRELAQSLGCTSIIAALDARLGQVYWARYAYRDAAWTPMSSPSLSPLEVVFTRDGDDGQALAEQTLLVADSVSRSAMEVSLAAQQYGHVVEALPSAQAVAELASQRLSWAQLPGHGEILPLYLGGDSYWKTQEEQRAQSQ